MSGAASRRAMLCGLAALPVLGSPALAVPTSLSAAEAQLLSHGPELISLLDQFDQLWSPVDALFSVADRARHESRHADGYDQFPEWRAYMAARRPADAIAEKADSLYEPFWDAPLTTMPAILLRHRFGMSFDAYREDALDDLDRMWRDGRCA